MYNVPCRSLAGYDLSNHLPEQSAVKNPENRVIKRIKKRFYERKIRDTSAFTVKGTG